MAIDPLAGGRVKPPNPYTDSITIPMLPPEDGRPNSQGKKNQSTKHIQKFPFTTDEWQSY
jgi:hypothetical protein